MGQMVNILVIVGILIIVALRYARRYEDGLVLTLFLIVVLPDRLCFQPTLDLPALTVHRLLLVLATIMWLKQRSIRRKIRGVPFAYFFLFISLAYLLPTLTSAFPLVSIKRYLYFFAESVFFFFICQTSLREKRSVYRAIRWVGMGLVTVAVLGILERYTGFNIQDYLPVMASYDFNKLGSQAFAPSSHIVSTYNHRILFGAACAVGTTHYFLQAGSHKEAFKNLQSWIFVGFCGAGLYFCLSRGPWLAFIVTMAFLCLAFPWKILPKTLLLSLLIVLAMFVKPGATETLLSITEQTFDPESLKGSSYNWRFTVMQVGWDTICNGGPVRFLFGYGGGSHVFMEFSKVQLSTGHWAEMLSWDSELVIILLERGIVGLSAVILLYLVIGVRALSFIYKRKQGTLVMLVAFSWVVNICVAKASVAIFAPQLVYLEALGFALVSSLLMTADKNAMRFKAKRLQINET